MTTKGEWRDNHCFDITTIKGGWGDKACFHIRIVRGLLIDKTYFHTKKMVNHGRKPCSKIRTNNRKEWIGIIGIRYKGYNTKMINREVGDSCSNSKSDS